MKRVKKKKSRSISRDGTAFQMLSNPLAEALYADDEYGRVIASFIAENRSQDFREQFKRLYKKNKFRAAFNAGYSRIEDISSRPIFNDRVSRDRTVDLFECIFIEHEAELRRFSQLRREFDQSLLMGDYGAASVVLDSAEAELGESIWLVRSKILLLHLDGRSEDAKNFADHAISRSGDGFIGFLFNCFLFTTTDPLLHLQGFVLNNIEELDQAGVQNWADFLSLIFVPRPLFQQRPLLSCFSLIQILPVCDQFHWAHRLLIDALAHDDINALMGYGKERLLRFLNYIEEVSRDSFDTGLGVEKELVSAYEYDDLSIISRAFGDLVENKKNPFPLSNIIAKTKASFDWHCESVGEGPFSEIVKLLAGLYQLSAPPRQLEESLQAISIQLHNIAGSQYIQFSLIKAMPYRYTREDRMWSARCSLSENLSLTPWAKWLATQEDPFWNYKYVGESNLLPLYRKIKQNIKSGGSEVEIEELLISYKSQAPLKKDYFEIASAYATDTDNLEFLLPLCANALAENPNAYIAFPMRMLVQHIEDNSLNGLDIITILYFFVRKIDERKEYLLNETFEEFIAESGAVKPSDLIDSLNGSDSRVQIFYRDVAGLETLDFLSCFNDSDEWRSERVKILDYLRSIGAVSAEDHRSEVDDIVGQVVVDSGVTEFNVGKINVNVAALMRLVKNETESLYKLYHSASDNEENKFLKIGDAYVDGTTARAVVTGDRNTTLLKIIHTVQHAFLFDEKHGLDKNLSGEIRHGWFSNLMRSRPEEEKLLTEIDESGQYKKNEFWLRVNALVSDEIRLNIDKDLAWFSAEFNALVLEGENWMRVTSDSDGSSAVFNYWIFTDNFIKIKEFADINPKFDDFLSFLFDFLWGQTEYFLSIIREKINVDLKNRVDDLFIALLSRIERSRQGAALVELHNAVGRTKNDIVEDVITISEWFKRGANTPPRDRSVRELINIAIVCFERVKGFVPVFCRTLGEGPAIQQISGEHVKSFIVSLVNLFDNAYRHSGFGGSTVVSIEAENRSRSEMDKSWAVVVTNPLTESAIIDLTAQRIWQLDQAMRGTASLEKMREEGGSGLVKVYNQLRTISNMFDVKISVNGGRFHTEITYGASVADC